MTLTFTPPSTLLMSQHFRQDSTLKSLNLNERNCVCVCVCEYEYVYNYYLNVHYYYKTSLALNKSSHFALCLVERWWQLGHKKSLSCGEN